jgi:aromatic ring-cleaving dioxygenase
VTGAAGQTRRLLSRHNDASFIESVPSVMNYLDPAEIGSWHAHVYFDAATRDAAWTLREAIEARFGDALQMGRFHERPVGPHPMWSYQLAFSRGRFVEIFEWLTLNHGQLDVFVHSNTDDSLRDHRDCATWIGRSHRLNLEALGG